MKELTKDEITFINGGGYGQTLASGVATGAVTGAVFGGPAGAVVGAHVGAIWASAGYVAGSIIRG
ncbi:TPA: Blp family class II bacteriocin [Bacillus cereus]|nr:Blp family class II bacteriocin [Bacillus cereus]